MLVNRGVNKGVNKVINSVGKEKPRWRGAQRGFRVAIQYAAISTVALAGRTDDGGDAGGCWYSWTFNRMAM